MLIVLVGLFLLTRLYQLVSFMPLFMDEALYIRWLTEIKSTNNWLLPLQEFGWEPLNIWIAALINHITDNRLLSLR